jgi:hypothetical protein
MKITHGKKESWTCDGIKPREPFGHLRGTNWEEGRKKQKIHPTPSRKGMTVDKKQCILGF